MPAEVTVNSEGYLRGGRLEIKESVDAREEGGGGGRKRVGEGVESLEFSLSSAEVRDSEEQE